MDLSNGGGDSSRGDVPTQDTQAGDRPVKVVFIAGASFCGSTLLSFVLNAHPQILSIGEMGPTTKSETEDYLCSCGTRLIECPFFLKVQEGMARQGLRFDLRHWGLRHRYSESRFWNLVAGVTPYSPAFLAVRDAIRDRVPRWRKRIRDCRLRNEVFIRAALEAAGASVFLDATKHPTRIPLLERMNVDLRVIHLIRDPRGYCYSVRRHGLKASPSPAHEWVQTNKLAEYYLRRLPRDRWRQVTYESICTDPQRGLRELTDFMGVEPLVLPDNFRDFPHHVIGNMMRLSSDNRVTIQLDEKWRTVLSSEDLRITTESAGSVAREYGYDI